MLLVYCQNKEDAISEMRKYPEAFDIGCGNILSGSWKEIVDDNQVIGYAVIKDKFIDPEEINGHKVCYEEYEFLLCIITQYRGNGKGKQAIDLVESEIKRMNPNARAVGRVKSTNPNAYRMVKMLKDKGYRVKGSIIQSGDLVHAKKLLAATNAINDVNMYKQL